MVNPGRPLEPGAEVGNEAFRLLESASGQEDIYENLRRHHTDWWSDFWARTFLHLTSDDGVAQFMRRIRTLHLYYMASTSRGKLPAKWNASLNRSVNVLNMCEAGSFRRRRYPRIVLRTPGTRSVNRSGARITGFSWGLREGLPAGRVP